MHVEDSKITGIPDLLPMFRRLNEKRIVAGKRVDGVTKASIPVHVARNDQGYSPPSVLQNPGGTKGR